MARSVTHDALREFRQARVAAGLSYRDVGRAVGLSPSQVGRLARGEIRDVTLGQVCRLHAAVGLVTTMRAFPLDDPIRDASQVRLMERLRVRLATAIRLRTEVTVPGHGELRAWDGVLDGHGCTDALEAESRVGDIQAMERRIMRKHRDDPTIKHVFLVVSDTRSNRDVLRVFREQLRGNFPLDTSQVLASLSAGRCPGASGIIVI